MIEDSTRKREYLIIVHFSYFFSLILISTSGGEALRPNHGSHSGLPLLYTIAEKWLYAPHLNKSSIAFPSHCLLQTFLNRSSSCSELRVTVYNLLLCRHKMTLARSAFAYDTEVISN